MNRRFGLVSTGFIIFLLLVQPSPTASAELDTTLLGVSVGDTFTYVLEKYPHPEMLLAFNSTSSYYILVTPGEEFTITLTNITVLQPNSFYEIEADYSNGTHHAIKRLTVDFLGYVLFTDWDFYFTFMTNAINEAIFEGEVDSYALINDENEFVLAFNGTDFDDELYLEMRYDKITGTLLYLHISNIINLQLEETMFYQKGYVRQEIPNMTTVAPISSSTSSSSSSSDQTTETDSSVTSSTTATTFSTSEGVTSTSEDLTSKTSTSSSDANLPGFQLYMVIFALFTTITALRRKE